MNHFIVTIGREFGSSGKEIGRELAWHLGVECYDRNIVEKAVEDSGLSLDVVSKAEERFAAGSSRLLSIGGLSLNSVMQMDAAVEAQSNVIKDLAEKSSCVIIGRCADFILRDRDDVLNVFIYAPYEKRLKRIIDLYGFSKQQAERSVKRIDQQRHNYYKYVTGQDRGDRHGKQLMIDSSLFGIKGTADLLFEIVCKRFDLNIEKAGI